jgi:D-threo-aldose 1-dehydrogenase
LQFSTKNPGIASTVVGVSAPERVDELARNAVVEIPQELWDLVEDRLQYGATNGG